MIDAFAYEPQFLDHIAPVWRALPVDVRGTLYVDPALVDRAISRGVTAVARPRPRHEPAYPPPRHDGPLALVASYGDIKEARRFGYGPFAFMEHGAGQSYANKRNGSYAGGPDRTDNELILVPNDQCAATWRGAYPKARVELVGCPRLDSLPQREGDPSPRVVALSFHWPAPMSVSPCAGTALGDWLRDLPALAREFTVIGHAHPKGDWPRQVAKQYRRLGIEFVPEFDDVCRRADVYVCDNSSTIWEFASTGRPVVLLNAKAWTRKVSYGLRFWDAADVGDNLWPGEDLVGAVHRALDDGPARRAQRERAVDRVYSPRTGGVELAVAAITGWVNDRSRASSLAVSA